MIPETFESPMKGIKFWKNQNGVHVAEVHWSADEALNDAWADKTAAKYGGRKSAYWRSEYEIDFGARRGGLVFPDFMPDRHTIHPLSEKLLETLPKWRSIDPGLNHPTACGWFTVLDGVLIMYREFKKSDWKVPQLCQAIKAMSGKEEYEYTLIDSAAYAATLAGGGRSVADLFVEGGIRCSPCEKPGRKKDQIPALAQLMTVRDHGEPRFKVTTDCPEFVREVLQYRWKEERDDGTIPEEPVKVMDDLLDTAIYLALKLNPARVQELRRDIDDYGFKPQERRRSSYSLSRLYQGADQEP